MARAVAYEITNQVHRIDADEACAVVTDFLLDNVGNQLVAGEPHIMVSALRSVWIVPVQLAYIHTGTLGSVGFVAVDDETGHVIAWTPIPDMKTASRRLRESREPELSAQFQAFMNAQTTRP
jgi:hypothetical protein